MNAITIAWFDLRRSVRERQTLFWMFIAPVIFAAFFGIVTRPSPPRPTVVSIVDEDAPGPLAGQIGSLLSADGLVVRVVRTAPRSRFVLVVPRGSSDALAANEPLKLVLKTGAEQTEEERRVRFKIEKAVVSLTLQNPGDSAAAATGPLAIAAGSLDVRKQPPRYGFQLVVPAYLIMFVFMNLLVSGAGLAEDRASGRLRRLTLTPAGFGPIVVGKLLSRFAIGWVQAAWLLALGLFVFGVDWGPHPGLLCAFVSLFALTSAALGILIGTLFADPDKCAMFAVWSVMILSPLGGLWWPLEVVGPTLRRVAAFIPTGWGIRALNSMMGFGGGIADVAPFAAALAGLFTAAMFVAVRRLRRQTMA